MILPTLQCFPFEVGETIEGFSCTQNIRETYFYFSAVALDFRSYQKGDQS